MKKVYFVTFALSHKKSKKRLDTSSSDLKIFTSLELAKELFNDLVSIHKGYVGNKEYSLHIKLYEPIRLRSTGELTNMVGKMIEEFSFVGEFFKKKNTEEKNEDTHYLQ